MKQINQKLNDGARHGLVSSKQRVHYYLEMMMLHAAKHPWMRWLTVSVDLLSRIFFILIT